MRKSKAIKWCLLALPLALFALAAAGCGEEDHTHTFSAAWAFDAQSHWHAATCSHDVKSNKSAHVFTETIVEPSETSAGYTLHVCACGYSYTSDPTDSRPSESGGLRYNENGHWTSVLDGDVAPVVTPHNFEDETVPATCATGGYTKHTCECGYWYADTPTAPLGDHETDENVWAHSETAHWHPCLKCGLPVGAEAHDLYTASVVRDCDTGTFSEMKCADCGYSFLRKESEDGHTYEENLSWDQYTHWYGSSCGHAEAKKDVEDHFLVGDSPVCKVCGFSVEPRLAYQLSADGTYYIVTGMGCFKGEAITIPAEYREKPVKEIQARAFFGADITSVTFHENLEKIGASAFSGTHISALSLPGTLREIGGKAFESTDITELTLGSSVEKIGQAAFRDCASLRTVTLASRLVLAAEVFEGCGQLESVTGEGLTEVGAHAFYGCAELSELDISSVTKVGFAAFADCAQFAPDNLTALAEAEQYAFAGTAVANLTLTNLARVEDNLFENCTSLGYISLSAESIGSASFAGCTALGTVSLTNTVTIGESAFKNCETLSELTLPATVVRVGANAFEGCTALISEEGGVKYAANVLLGATAETANIQVKAGTVGIIDEAFRNDTEAGNTTLTGVTLSAEMRFIGVNAFRGCKGLGSIQFTEGVKIIGANAFRESGLVNVTVPATVDTVGDNAFYDCMSLTTVSVSARQIGKFAFSYTGVNRTLDSPVKVRPTGAKLTTLTIGAGVENIGSNAFQYAPITQVTLPQTLETIGGYAFAQTDLAQIVIPAEVTRIGAYAFYGCTRLTSATFTTAQGWKAGGTALSLGSASQNATSLKNATIDWMRGE